MYGALEWHKAATKAGLHPIVGIEAYLAEGSMKNRERKIYHLLLLAENDAGYRNLLRLASKASLEGYLLPAAHRSRASFGVVARGSSPLPPASAVRSPTTSFTVARNWPGTTRRS